MDNQKTDCDDIEKMEMKIKALQVVCKAFIVIVKQILTQVDIGLTLKAEPGYARYLSGVDNRTILFGTAEV